jgi:L-aminopeptidase/D-esterase-like protein
MMTRKRPHLAAGCALLATTGLALADASAGERIGIGGDQANLVPVLNDGKRVLEFDWPTIRIGTGQYEEGPTGVTVINFTRRVHGAVDVRGGGPGTVNTDYLRIGYAVPELDAVVFSGGSWYGLEGTTAVATALKDDGIRDGTWTNLSLSVGAIVYDFGERRLNELYPDKRLAQAALRAARPGVFPLGPHGAGRFVKTGGLFHCDAHSGQGAAFRQIGDLKIAAFVVVNALGVVTRRDGRVAACYRNAGWPEDLRAADLLASYPSSRKPGSKLAPAADDARRNTTISLIVTNQRLDRPQLERLAAQVHTSMARALQPFATEFDGDVLYAVSTGELDRRVDESDVTNIDLDVIASELMWDAILSSVPEQPVAPRIAAGLRHSADELARFAGDYVFSPFVQMRVTARDGRLLAQATGLRKAYAIGREAPVVLEPVSRTQFTVPGRYPLTLDLTRPGELVLNPGHWQQVGRRSQN